MIQHSGISSKEIYDKFCKLQRTSSDYRFRVKSLRIKTINNDLDEHIVQKIGLPVIYPNQSTTKFNAKGSHKKIFQNQESSKSLLKVRSQSYKIIEKNYEEELNKIGVDSEFLGQLFQKKCQETETKYTQHKYQAFVKNLYQRLNNNKHLSICHMGLGPKSLHFFFQWYVQWPSHISQVDLTYSSDLLKEFKMEVIKSLLTEDKKLIKIVLCNSDLEGQELSSIFEIINKQKQLFALDIGNQNSQDLNRLGVDSSKLQQFFSKNQSVAIVKLNNLHIKKEGFESLCRGVVSRRQNPLRILSLASNHITGGKVCQYFHNILRSGLTHLDLSNNPLGNDFFKNMPPLKGITLKQLKLINTSMCSQNLYDFFEKLQESKTLSVLKVDNNDFSHHWFGKIGQKLEVNSSLLWLSLNNCQIKTLAPLFHGLTHNKFLKRLDANNNEVDCLHQDTSKIITFFTFNKDLQEMRFKFCGLKEDILMKMIEGVSKNKKLRVLDISENIMEDTAANSILKMLEQNMVIESIGIQKLQLSQLMRKRIIKKLQENSAIRERQEFTRLKSQTLEMKSTDSYSWDDLFKIEAQQRRLIEYAKTLQEKTLKLESMITTKRDNLIQLIKDHKDEDHYFEAKIQDRLRQENEKTQKLQKHYDEFSIQEQKLKAEIERQLSIIKKIEEKIKEKNQKNKEMQNQCQDRLRNHKYLQRKKSKNQNIVSLSPRKSSNCPVHPQR